MNSQGEHEKPIQFRINVTRRVKNRCKSFLLALIFQYRRNELIERKNDLGIGDGRTRERDAAGAQPLNEVILSNFFPSSTLHRSFKKGYRNTYSRCYKVYLHLVYSFVSIMYIPPARSQDMRKFSSSPAPRYAIDSVVIYSVICHLSRTTR